MSHKYFSAGIKWHLILFACLILCSVTVNAETILQVKGTVTGKTDGEPIIGASVIVKETKNATVTDIDGKYSIEASVGQTLEFRYIGYITKLLKVTSSTMNVIMSEDQQTIDEVVVVGYGTMKRSDLTGAVTSVTDKDMMKSISTSFDQALQGRAAGVAVTQNSGAPGGGISVSIRGTNSLNGNEPLYVIDGIPVSGSSDGNTNALSNINPADIVTMEVLKDASACAIYGSRASNGVVIITTKRGKSGKTKFSYEGYFALQQLPKKLEVLNLREFAEYRNTIGDIFGYGKNSYHADPSILGNGTDWQGELFRTAPMYNHQVRLSGGGDTFQYMVSGAYLSQEGIAIGSDFDRFSARVNLDTKPAKWLKVGFNASGAYSKQINTIDNGGIIETAIRQLPDTPARNPDGSFGTQQSNMYGTYYPNPIEEALQRENYNKKTDLFANAFGEIEFMKGLTFRIEYGGNFYYSNSYSYTPSYDYKTYKQQSSGYRSANNGYSTVFKTFINFNRDFGRHSVGAMLGHEAQTSGWESLSGSRTNYLFNTIHELNGGDDKTAKNSSSRGSWAMESYFGRVNYSFDDRYLMTATLRADGSSNLGKDNRWGVFPSVALAWRISNEAFLKDVKWLSNLKLRLGWGIVGNQNASSYAYGTKLTSATSPWGTGFYAENYPNPDLKWEETKAYNVGLDLSLFQNRIELIVEAYKKNTDNLIIKAALPNYVSGIISSPYVNAGAMENKGFELTLNTVNINSKKFTWRSGLTFSINRNKVVKLYTETSGISGDVSGKTYTYTAVGQPVGQFYGYQCIGMFKSEADFYQKDANGFPIYDNAGNKIPVALPKGKKIGKNEVWVGDYMWLDKNGDGVIDEQDRMFLGNPEPKFTYGFDNTFRYRDFDLNIFITGSVGNKLYNYIRSRYLNPGFSGALKDALNFARVELIDPNGEENISNVHVANKNPATYRIATVTANDNDRISNLSIEDGSYLRIKNISLGYSLPKELLSKVGIEQLRFYVNIQNAFTFTKYKGYDPEVGAYQQNVLTRGIDYARYPSQRIWTMGASLKF